MPPMQLNLQGGGDDDDQEASCWLEDSDSSREKFEGQTTYTKKEKKDRKKTKTQLQENQPSQQPDTVRNSAAQLCAKARSRFPSTLLWSCHPQETLREG